MCTLCADITGGPCREYSYVLQQFHLHWGEADSAGSEHFVNGLPTAAEVRSLRRLLLGNDDDSVFIASGQLSSGFPSARCMPAPKRNDFFKYRDPG